MKKAVIHEPVWFSDTAWFYPSDGHADGLTIYTEKAGKVFIPKAHLPTYVSQAMKKYLFHLSPCPIAKGDGDAKCTCGLAELRDRQRVEEKGN